MKKVCVIGHFGFGRNLLNGQTVKTKIITKELKKQLGKENVLAVDTHGGKKIMLKLIFKIGSIMKYTSNIIIMPAHNGVCFFAPLLYFWKRIYHRKIHYIVIGGWLPEFITNKNWLKKCLKQFDGIYVETNTMKKLLEKQGFQNIYVMPNCKELHILKEEELKYSHGEPYKLCTFSRVMREKGIEDAVNAVKEINIKENRTVFILDIYGQVDQEQVAWFDELKKTFPEYISYKGVIPFDKSTDVLKEYFALLFPTYYEGEGFAGTLIDAMAAGVPVLASDWKYNNGIIKDRENGTLFQPHNIEQLCSKLVEISKKPDEWRRMGIRCIEDANLYRPENAMRVLFKNLK